jgi:D-alanyl-D-alanine-carboxypeptidase/D-alanyl-D-alanine-endopeptidase
VVRAAIALTGLLVAVACGCRFGPAVDRPLATPSPRLSGFVPGAASAERKAKLEAVRGKLDDLFQSRVREARATGAAVGIVIDGELVYANTFGVRDVVSNRPIDVDTVFRIASMTKSFTALAIMKLRDDGKVVLDAPAATYVPELRSFVGLTRDAPAITVRMLLTHASGIAFDDFWGGDTFGMSDDELTRFIQSGIGLSYAPGTRYQYSNLGYALLGRIVERASGRPFRAYVTDEILESLGMTSTV